MNTDINFMKIAEDDKAFVRHFENFVNGKVNSTEKCWWQRYVENLS